MKTEQGVAQFPKENSQIPSGILSIPEGKRRLKTVRDRRSASNLLALPGFALKNTNLIFL